MFANPVPLCLFIEESRKFYSLQIFNKILGLNIDQILTEVDKFKILSPVTKA